MHSAAVSGISILITLGLASLTLYLVGKHRKRKAPPQPLACDVLRGPGHTHSARIEELGQELQVCQLALFIFPMLALAAHAALSYFGATAETLLRTALSCALLLLFMAYYARRLSQLLAVRRSCRLRCDGEKAVGHELSLLANDGYRVFHDFPAEGFKIDHIVVGPTGVMVVETVTRSHHRPADAVLTYDGRMMHFPKFSDYETLEQVNLKAEWISQWLSTVTGEDVCARAMVAVPGWSVKRTSADGIPVVNPRQFDTLFKHIKPRPMTAHLMQRIILQIEGRCRQVSLTGTD